jgi:predicted transcriptional regulator
MKKTLRVGIASPAEMKARTMAIARGTIKPSSDDPKVWFTSTESFAKVLSNRNRALLDLIAQTEPESLQELAEKTGRAASNLSRTLRTMERYGFVRLHRGARGRLRPEVPYGAISLTLPLGHEGATRSASRK